MDADEVARLRREGLLKAGETAQVRAVRMAAEGAKQLVRKLKAEEIDEVAFVERLRALGPAPDEEAVENGHAVLGPLAVVSAEWDKGRLTWNQLTVALGLLRSLGWRQ